MKKKITPLQYAIFLYEITSGKSDIKKNIKGFIEILVKNNDLGKIDEIIKEFEAYEKKQRGVKEAELISAEPLAAGVKKQISELMKGAGRLEIKEIVDPDMIGGLTMIIGDTMVDGSLRRKLAELKKTLA